MRSLLFIIAIWLGWASPAWSQQPAFAFAPQNICRAAIGAIMGRDPKTISVVKTQGDVVYVSYVRPSDKSVWSQRCRVSGNRILWASEPGGRWRDDPRDEAISYEANDKTGVIKIIQKFTDGSTVDNEYKMGVTGR